MRMQLQVPMQQKKQIERTPAVIVIVLYKCILVGLLLTTSTALLLLLENRGSLVQFSAEYLLPAKSGLLNWVLEKLLNLRPRTLEYSAIGVGLYGCVNAIEAIGLWYRRTWASLLVVVLTGITLPPELYEIVQHPSWLKVALFGINLFVFLYLLREAQQQLKRSG